MVKLLIDADILIHKAGHSCSTASSSTFDGPNDSVLEDLVAAKVKFLGLLDDIRNAIYFDSDGPPAFLAVTQGRSFRYGLLESYKGHRKPHLEIIKKLTAWVLEELEGVGHPGIEADDILGMHQTEDTVICSEDKDLLQIPGKHFNWRTGSFFTISQEEGLRNFYRQILSGDSSDNYKGCPRIGEKQAKEVVESVKDPADLWSIILDCYRISGSTEAEALKMARLAYILHPEDQPDYLWSPPTRKEKQ